MPEEATCDIAVFATILLYGMLPGNFLGYGVLEQAVGWPVFFLVCNLDAKFLAATTTDKNFAISTHVDDPVQIHTFQWAWSVFLIITNVLAALFTGYVENPRPPATRLTIFVVLHNTNGTPCRIRTYDLLFRRQTL